MSALGLGCRSLSSSHERPVELNDALDVLNLAVDNGVTFFDTSDFYGTKHSNEKLLGVVCLAIILTVFLSTCLETYMI